MGVTTNSSFLFSLLFLLFTFNLPIISHGSDTISANQSLSGDQTLVSANGTFKLGFYDQPGNSSNYYICIVYNKVSLPNRTIAWMANRDKPISDKYSSGLKIMDGNLVLLNESQMPIWSTNQSSTASSSVVAVLGDDGNLVVKDGFNSTQPIWQSFDFPTDTLLPGGKIGYNKRTKTHQNLTSWKNSEDPSRGLFSLSLKADTKECVISWNGTKQYWTSGPWQGQIFSWVPEMGLRNSISNFSYVDNENESYFMYSMNDPAVISRFVMGVSGEIKLLPWSETSGQWNLLWSQPREQCEVSALCGAFGACNGTQPVCKCLKGFSPKSVGDWNLNDYSVVNVVVEVEVVAWWWWKWKYWWHDGSGGGIIVVVVVVEVVVEWWRWWLRWRWWLGGGGVVVVEVEVEVVVAWWWWKWWLSGGGGGGCDGDGDGDGDGVMVEVVVKVEVVVAWWRWWRRRGGGGSGG
ncbi:hypothetical protein RHMOL_Rhmol04G0087100 [Rhododendron molle]|uniref:Uncharacterized protein n=1 Tax=Rhododendron molle TaxID=49168 RepID=A0ACC0P057_RHOML|nr:hypothetical protein RHMOL_Rhmol04G0087100 [Rhododendron molle]